MTINQNEVLGGNGGRPEFMSVPNVPDRSGTRAPGGPHAHSLAMGSMVCLRTYLSHDTRCEDQLLPILVSRHIPHPISLWFILLY